MNGVNVVKLVEMALAVETELAYHLNMVEMTVLEVIQMLKCATLTIVQVKKCSNDCQNITIRCCISS